MTEPKDLLLVNEQLRRSNRRWKALALAACAVVILVGLLSAWAQVQRMRAETALNQVLAREHQARVAAQQATNLPPPR